MKKFLSVLVCFFSITAFAQTIDQQLVVTQNLPGASGFKVAVQVKGNGLTAANTIKSSTIDINYDNSKVTYVNSTFNAGLSAGNGYTRSTTNNTTFLRVLITGGGVNASDDGGVTEPGFDITSSYVTWVTLNFTITNAAATTDFTIATGSNAISIFSTHSNSDNSGVSGTSSFGTRTNITSVALPVELTAFNAIAKGRNVELTWKTATETNNSGFEIQRSVAGVSEWAKVSFVEGNGTSNSAHSYTFTDAVKAAGKYSYRLKQIDRDGKFEYSQAVEAVATLNAADYALSSNYPNPFNPSTKFTFAVKNNENVSVKVFNAIGQEVASLFNGLAAADNIYEMNFNASALSSGTYFYMLKTKDRYEVKKMLLMK